MTPISPAHSSCQETILLVVSRGLSDFIQNTLTSIERCFDERVSICLALPRNALDEVSAAVSRWPYVVYFVLDDIGQDDYSWLGGYHDHATDAFVRFMRSKWLAIEFLLKLGFQRVTYTDIDIAWRHNPMALLRSALNVYEVAIQTEGVKAFPPIYCAGFMSWRKSPFTLGLLDDLKKASLSNPTINDQKIFRAVVVHNELVQRIFALSELQFANGLLARALEPRDEAIENFPVKPLDPIIFHANWTVGLKNKRLLLERTGNWLLA
jgi:hypothetical protein